MKELYIIWGIIVGFIMLSANSKGEAIFGSLFDGDGGSGYGHSSGYSRGWGGGGGFHK